MVMIYSNTAYVSTPQLQLTVGFLESLIWIMEEGIIRSLLLTGNYMQSEGGMRIGISLYEIFVNLEFKKILWKIFIIQSRNTIHKRMNGVKSETLT